MDATLPKSQEEFNLYFFNKLNEMDKSNETLHGDVRVSIANHNNLKERVDNIEDDARSATRWENGKFIVMGLLQTALIWVKHTATHGV